LRAIEGHKGVLASIEKGDVEEINQAIKKHLEQSKKDILLYAFKENEAKTGKDNMKMFQS
jgi:DNA-binding GntR family transcriptional regulator